MRLRHSIAVPLIGLLALVSSGAAVVGHFANMRAVESSVQESEYDKISHIGYIVEATIGAEAPRLSALARTLKDHGELNRRFGVSGRENPFALREVANRLYVDTQADLFMLVDAAQSVLYRAHDGASHGDRFELPAVGFALAGEDAIEVAKADGVVVLAASPLAATSGKAAGAVVVGTRMNDGFARRLARQVRAEIAFASEQGIWASSRSERAFSADMRTTVQYTINTDIPVFQSDKEARKARLFMPLRIGSEPFVVVIDTDTSHSHALLEQAERRLLMVSAGLLAAAIVLGALLTLRIVRPLSELKRRAQQTAAGVTGETIESSEGSEIDSLVHVIDRTTRALSVANREVAKREREVRLVTDSLPLGVAYVGADQRYRYVNLCFAQWCGRSVDEIVGRTVVEVVGAELYAKIRVQIDTALRGESVSYEREHVTADERRIYYYSRLVPQVNEDGVVLGYYAMIEDVTERKLVQTQSERASAFMSAIIDAMPSPVFVKDDRHAYIALNDAMCEFTGKPREQFLGRTDYDVFPEHEADVFWANDQAVFESGLANESEESFTDAAGVTHWILTRKRGYVMPGGKRMLVGVGSSRVDLQACKLEYSIVSPK